MMACQVQVRGREQAMTQDTGPSREEATGTPKAHRIETIPSIISIAGTSIIATALTLGAGKDYEKAFEFGRSAIDLKGIPEYLTPVLKKKT